MDNRTLAQKFLEHAKNLEQERENLYRIRAFRRAADTLLRLEEPVSHLVAEKGKKALQDLPGIGSHLGYAIECLLTRGEFHAMTETAYRTPKMQRISNLPGVGPHLAQLLWEKLGILSLPELEKAIQNRQLDQLPSGPKRRQQLVDALQKYKAPSQKRE